MTTNLFMVRIVTTNPLSTENMESIVRQGLLMGSFNFELFDVAKVTEDDE